MNTLDEVLIPIDTKSRQRHRIYDSDIVQLSTYGVILRQLYRERKIANYGFIRTVIVYEDGSESVRYHKVKLLKDKKIVQLYHQEVKNQKFSHVKIR